MQCGDELRANGGLVTIVVIFGVVEGGVASEALEEVARCRRQSFPLSHFLQEARFRVRISVKFRQPFPL